MIRGYKDGISFFMMRGNEANEKLFKKMVDRYEYV